jgi:hypothetical protein
MRKPNRLPREQAQGSDGLPAGTGPTDQDVEGHGRLPGTGGDELSQRLPGTGGDFRRPSGGGELTEDDVEGHIALRSIGEGEASQRLPGTGGDFRRPSGGGEATDETEGHL